MWADPKDLRNCEDKITENRKYVRLTEANYGTTLDVVVNSFVSNKLLELVLRELGRHL